MQSAISHCLAFCFPVVVLADEVKRDGGGWREECGGATAETLESGCHVNMWRPR